MSVGVRRGDWMATHTGRMFWPLDPDPADIDIVDIAHALSNLCRYGGHTRRFYSVAEHCVLMADALGDPAERRWALLHDASEAYLVDVPRPIKWSLGGYREAEALLMHAVCTRFGLPPDMPARVREFDDRILADEQAQAMTATAQDWTLGLAPIGVELVFWRPAEAEAAFLSWFRHLFPEAV